MKKILSILTAGLLITAAMIGAASCSSYSSPATTTHSNTQTSPPAGQTPGPDYTPGQTVNVSIENFSFVPAAINITAGTTVTWKNNDSATHTIVSDTGVFKSGDLATGGTFSYTFSNKGTYAYHCSIHSSMKGTVVVQ
jgi:plastocyanin